MKINQPFPPSYMNGPEHSSNVNAKHARYIPIFYLKNSTFNCLNTKKRHFDLLMHEMFRELKERILIFK